VPFDIRVARGSQFGFRCQKAEGQIGYTETMADGTSRTWIKDPDMSLGVKVKWVLEVVLPQ